MSPWTTGYARVVGSVSELSLMLRILGVCRVFSFTLVSYAPMKLPQLYKLCVGLLVRVLARLSLAAWGPHFLNVRIRKYRRSWPNMMILRLQNSATNIQQATTSPLISNQDHHQQPPPTTRAQQPLVSWSPRYQDFIVPFKSLETIKQLQPATSNRRAMLSPVVVQLGWLRSAAFYRFGWGAGLSTIITGDHPWE